KLVVLRNKETGETYSFIMAVVPELNYMLRKGDELNKITYLSRDSDFDGYIFFFTLDGHLINGWLYEDGKVTGGTNLSGDGKRTKIAKAMYMEIKVCGSYMVECGGGSGGGVDCYTYIEVVYIEDGIGNPSSGGGGNIQYPNSGGGTNTDSWVPIKPTPSDKEKKPGERTDCTEQAAANAKNADAIMNRSDNEIKNKANALRSMAKNNSNYEYSTSIGSVNGETFYMANIEEGTGNYATAGFAQSTIYGLHTHNNKNGYTGPSVADIYTLLQANNVLYKKYYDNEGYNLAGGIIFASDGSEYLISIEDRSKANTFYKNQGSLFTPDSSHNYFQDSTLKVKFEDIMDNLLTKGYSHQNSYDFAMTYILDSYNTGIKISKKEAEEKEFKELKTEYRNPKISYQPKKCP
ncbi:MAG: hypothetical protein LBT43_21260, partial [Prevotella sp.]|nr:hypothetical protein [Prevotella sp.]